MVEVLIQMALLIVCGVAWRRFSRRQSNAKAKREILTELVYYLLLPALVLDVLWSANLGVASSGIALVAASGVLVGVATAWAAYHFTAASRAMQGALILAAGFPNVTYLGLPVLQSTLGDWARAVAIQYDLFACTPLLFTLGIYIARVYGEGISRVNPFIGLLKVPPLWAAVAGASFNVSGIAEPQWLHGFLDKLASGVAPLMLISLGMSLEWPRGQGRNLPLLFPVMIIQLLLVPAFAWLMAGVLIVDPSQRTAVILEAAMPSMVFGIVLCDRFQLNTAIYAAAVTLSTVLSLITLPLWYRFLG